MRGAPLAALFGMLVTGGCSTPQHRATPPMWVVENGESRIVLLGSVHELPASVDWLNGAVSAEADRADVLLLEIAPAELSRAPAIFAAMASDEPVAPLAQRIPASQAAIVRQRAASAGITSTMIDRTESWALAIAVANSALDGTGLSADNGVEARLIARFAARGRPVGGLERASAQLAAFDDLTPAEQDAMLRASTDDLAAAPGEANAIIAAWSRGDVATLNRLAAASMAATPQLIEPVVNARNRAWAAQLADRLQHPGDTLVAVGAGHLVGPQGLPALLRARGFRVDRLVARGHQ